MKELIDAVKSYSLTDFAVIAFALYCAFEFVKGKITAHKKEKQEELNNYHDEKSKEEKKDSTINDRLDKLEGYIGNDREQIRGIGKHLDEIEEANGKIGEKVDELSITVRDMRIEHMRKTILDAVSECIDMHKNVSMERFQYLFKLYASYLEYCDQNNIQNHEITLAYSMLRHSFNQRLATENFTENKYLSPEDTKKKLKTFSDAIPGFWEEQDDLENIYEGGVFNGKN